jgi:hypothetical protein|tara:strand:+ start:407 stop:649 length:243 start_codon:yes stop_codon:yes gene_type:complete
MSIEINLDFEELELAGEAETGFYTYFLDAEGDVVHIKFNYDDCVYLDLKDYTYLAIQSEVLYRLAELVEEAEERYTIELK